MGAGGADHQAHAVGDVAHAAPQRRASCAAGLGDVRARRGRDLEHRLHQLRLDLAGDVVGHRVEDLLDRLRQLQRLGVADHQLLLDRRA